MKFLFAYILLILTIFSIVSNCHININMDLEDLGGVSEFFQTFNPNQHEYAMVPARTPTLLRRKIMKLIVKTTISIIHLVGVTFALVGSNLITTRFDQPTPMLIQLQPTAQQSEIGLMFKNISNIITAEKSNIDFGCHKNVCWRTCYIDSKNISSKWCYTSTNPDSREYQKCASPQDCSPLWECLESCHF